MLVCLFFDSLVLIPFIGVAYILPATLVGYIHGKYLLPFSVLFPSFSGAFSWLEVPSFNVVLT